MANEVAAALRPVDVLAPLGCHYYYNQGTGQWEVSLFAARTETVGGELDGRITASKFTVDLGALAERFSDISSMHWQVLPLGEHDELGSHVSVEGVYAGHPVWLRILATPPRRYGVGRYAHVYQRQLDDAW